MNYIEFKGKLEIFPVFSVQEIEKHFPGFDSRRLVEWQQKGYIQKIRNRFYRFTDRTVTESFLYLTANKIYQPSYISLESALSKYGFIPEGVFQFTSCTTRKTQTFNTSDGSFSYRNLKPSLFFGYQLETVDNLRFAIASPEKAIIDYLYLHHEINYQDHFRSLRWNTDEIINRISMEKLDLYENFIDSAALTHRLNKLKELLYAVA